MSATELSSEHERKLIWYLSEGQALSQRSNAGPMFANAELYGHALDLDASSNYLDPDTSKVKRIGRRDRSKETASPTSEGRVSSQHMPQEALVTKAADMSKMLRAVGRTGTDGRILMRALEHYYGHFGNRYAGGQPGRIFAVYIDTPAGKALLQWDLETSRERAKGSPIEVLPAHLRMENQASLEWGRSVLGTCGVRVGNGRCNRAPGHNGGHSPKPPEPHPKRKRRLMLTASDDEARALLSRAAVAWNEIE